MTLRPHSIGVEVGVVGALAGDVGVEPGGPGLADHAPRPAGDDADSGDPLGPAGYEPRARGEGAERPVHLAEECLARGQTGGGEPPDPDRAPLVVAEPALDLDAQPVGQDHVVADLGMEVERNVGRVQGDVVLEEGGDPAVAPAGDRDVAVPEQPVVHAGASGAPAARPSIVACEASTAATIAGDRALVLHLKAVDGVALVGDLADPEELVGIGRPRRPAARRASASLAGGRTTGGRAASMEDGRGAAIRVPAAIESAAAWTRDRRVAGTRVSRAGFGT